MGPHLVAINYERLLSLDIPSVEHAYSHRDTMLYALGLGLGHDPLDRDQLNFVYEANLRVLPTMVCVLGLAGSWARDLNTGIDYEKVVHGEQAFILHRPLAASGVVIGKTRIVEVIDKGHGKGALILSERRVTDKATGDLIATVEQATFARGNGGFGGPSASPRVPQLVPEREPDARCDLPTSPRAALLYRLSGDYNPLHSDPGVAERAGFTRPILHGLATFGVAGHALIKTLCGYDPDRLVAMACRFSSPVFPGETIRTEIWRTDTGIAFRAKVLERDVVVLRNGRAEVQS
jgi:acyl dehydratase